MVMPVPPMVVVPLAAMMMLPMVAAMAVNVAAAMMTSAVMPLRLLHHGLRRRGSLRRLLW